MRTRREVSEDAETLRDMAADMSLAELQDALRQLNRELHRRINDADARRGARTREMEAGGRAYLDGPYVEHCDDDF